MSSIRSIGASQASSIEWLRQVTSTSTAASSSAATAATAGSSVESASTSETSALKDQLQSAISSALEEAEDSGDTEDLLAVIAQAVQGVLEENGIEYESSSQASGMGPSGSVTGAPPQGAGPPMGPPPEGAEGSQDPGQEALAEALEASGVEGEELEDVLNQVQTAIDTALAEAEESGSSADRDEVIRNAVDSTLEANGIDPATVQENMPAPPAGGPPPGGPPPASGTESSTESDEQTTTTATAVSSEELTATLDEILASLFGGDGSDSMVGFLLDTDG